MLKKLPRRKLATIKSTFWLVKAWNLVMRHVWNAINGTLK
jgi:hypothetical protein